MLKTHWTRCLFLLASLSGMASAETGKAIQDRIHTDTSNGAPIVVHVVVALCDNANQGIVPVPEALGNGQSPRTNLYWGALYGVRTHLSRAGWTRLASDRPADERVLDRVVFVKDVDRAGASVPLYVVADAWDGAYIREALRAYLEMAAGRSAEQVKAGSGNESLVLGAGGASHLIAYVGHNGLMEFSLDAPASEAEQSAPRSSIVLACDSKSYFLDHLRTAGAHPLLLTTGLMAPEAYTLDAAIRAWAGNGSASDVIEAAAGAYARYQNCGMTAARRLFWGAP